MNLEKTKNQGTSQPEASQEKVNGDMASAEWEELVELDDVQLATVVGGLSASANTSAGGAGGSAEGSIAGPPGAILGALFGAILGAFTGGLGANG